MSKTTPALDMVEQSNRILSDWDARVQAYIDAGHDRDVAEQLARYQTERENRQKVARFVHEQTKRQIKAGVQGKGAARTNAQYIEPRAWVLNEWRRTKGQHLDRSGNPSKSAFVKHITKIPEGGGNSIFRKATGSLAAPSTIYQRWLNGVE